jgi:hypothetical protein
VSIRADVTDVTPSFQVSFPTMFSPFRLIFEIDFQTPQMCQLQRTGFTLSLYFTNGTQYYKSNKHSLQSLLYHPTRQLGSTNLVSCYVPIHISNVLTAPTTFHIYAIYHRRFCSFTIGYCILGVLLKIQHAASFLNKSFAVV